MLLSFRITNHRSIRREQQLLFTPAYSVDRPDDADWDAVPVVGIFGSNAAGKSNVIDGFDCMRRMVALSDRFAEPDGRMVRFPFRLDPEALTEPTRCVVDVSIQGIRYTYGFSIDDFHILDEWLYQYSNGKKQPRPLFERDGNGFTFDGTWSRDSGVDLVRKITAPNALFLSVAARSRQELVQPIYLWFQRGHQLAPTELPSRAIIEMLDNSTDRGRILELVRAADLGITDIIVETPSADVLELERRRRDFRRLSFTHKGTRGDASLTLKEQSRGTRALLQLAGPALQALKIGAVFTVDEVDGSLHPLLAARIIGLFQDPQTNPHGAQLLFTTNDATLLGSLHGEEVLKRDQIWFVEKDESGATALFPLSDFHPRRIENRERRYLGGSYGAVPFLPEESFVAALAPREGIESGQEEE
jgi:hypothetical protein